MPLNRASSTALSLQAGRWLSNYYKCIKFDLTQAFRGVLRYFKPDNPHLIDMESYSVDDKIDYIKECLAQHGSVSWTELLKQSRDRIELVCCFLAILELCKDSVIRAMQNGEFGEIRLFPAKDAAAQSIAS